SATGETAGLAVAVTEGCATQCQRSDTDKPRDARACFSFWPTSKRSPSAKRMTVPKPAAGSAGAVAAEGRGCEVTSCWNLIATCSSQGRYTALTAAQTASTSSADFTEASASSTASSARHPPSA